MKKMASIFLTIICALIILSACGNSGEQPKIDLIGTAKIDISHYIGGQEENLKIEDIADMENLTEWLNSLKLELKQFEKGNSPGDKNGGEVYMFTSDNNEFSYIINGSSDCYILYKSDWYQVKNPSSPPIE